MQSFCYCCCCLSSMVCRIGIFQNLNRKKFFLGVFLLSLTLVGGLYFWHLPYLKDWKEENAKKIPNQLPCPDICGGYVDEGTAANTCCWDLIGSCYTKEECQSQVDSYCNLYIMVDYCLLVLSVFYAAIYIMVIFVYGIKRCAVGGEDAEVPLLPPEVVPPADPINRSSQNLNNLNNLKESFRLRDSKNVCAICLDEFLEDNKAIQLECQHIFHGSCIRDWVKLHSTCPLCRVAV